MRDASAMSPSTPHAPIALRLVVLIGAVCQRLAQRLDQAVDELFRFSAELFDVRFDAVRAQSLWTVDSGFYYEFWSEPVSLEILSRAALFALPRSLGGPLLLRRMRGFVQEYAEKQSGRVRHDFAQRLERSAQAFKAAMLERVEATVAGVEAAVSKGTQLGETTTASVAARAPVLTQALAALAESEARLTVVLAELADAATN